MAGEISKRDSSRMSGVTTTMPLAASSWASRVNRGSSMPDTCSPEVRERDPVAGAEVGRRSARAQRSPRCRDPRSPAAGPARVSRSARRRGVPCRSAARMTNDTPCAYGAAISAAPDSVTVTASSDTQRERHGAHVTGIAGAGCREWEDWWFGGDRLASVNDPERFQTFPTCPPTCVS